LIEDSGTKTIKTTNWEEKREICLALRHFSPAKEEEKRRVNGQGKRKEGNLFLVE